MTCVRSARARAVRPKASRFFFFFLWPRLARAWEAGARAGALPTARTAPRRAPCARRRWQGCPRRARSTRSTVRSHVRGEGTGAGPGGRWEQRGARRGWPEAAVQRPVGEMEQIEDARARAERAGQPPCPRARGCAVERRSVSTRERLAFLPSPLAFGGVEHRLRHGKRWARGTRKLPARARFIFPPGAELISALGGGAARACDGRCRRCGGRGARCGARVSHSRSGNQWAP